MLLNYPIYSKKDTKRLMLYGYSLVYDWKNEEFNKLTNEIYKIMWYSVYNIWWIDLFSSLMPRMQWYNSRIDWNLWHKQALIENLKSGEYDVWFNERQRNENPDSYDAYRLPTDEELNE